MHWEIICILKSLEYQWLNESNTFHSYRCGRVGSVSGSQEALRSGEGEVDTGVRWEGVQVISFYLFHEKHWWKQWLIIMSCLHAFSWKCHCLLFYCYHRGEMCLDKWIWHDIQIVCHCRNSLSFYWFFLYNAQQIKYTPPEYKIWKIWLCKIQIEYLGLYFAAMGVCRAHLTRCRWSRTRVWPRAPGRTHPWCWRRRRGTPPGRGCRPPSAGGSEPL